DREMSQIGIKADNGKVTIAASDRIFAIFSDFECRVEESGTVFVPGRMFSDVVRQLPAGDVQVTVNQEFLALIAGPKKEFSMKRQLLAEVLYGDPPCLTWSTSANLTVNIMSYITTQVQF